MISSYGRNLLGSKIGVVSTWHIDMVIDMNELILVVDDEEDLRDVVRALLELNGFDVIEAENAEEMYNKIKNNNISLILLDIGLPVNDGLSALKTLRPKYDIPIVLLTGKGDVIDKVVGLELGADDYITKPFHSHELVARLRNILRRSFSTKSSKKILENEKKVISFNGWRLDVHAQLLINTSNEEINITGHEFAILHALINSAGRTLSRSQLLDDVAPGKVELSPYDRSLDVMVAKLRKKLGDSPRRPRFIRTVRQMGYMFIADVQY